MLYGLGNPLMDVIVRASHEALERLGVAPGSMNLVDYEQQQEAMSAGTIVRRLPGGSCANTVRGLRWLFSTSGSAAEMAYTGAVGRDRNGDVFETLLDTEGVTPLLPRKRTPTGSSVIVVTPDSQRTMFTYLGACRDLDSRDIDMQRVRAARVFHTTGYMWDTPNQEAAARSAAQVARESRTFVSFDVADPFVVGRYRESLNTWINGNVDLLFANEEELRALTGERDGVRALQTAARGVPVVVMKTGARGCSVIDHGVIDHVEPYPATRLDTTGAGDAFAAGYLFGLLHSRGTTCCATIANTLAAGIVAVEGCNYDALDASAVGAAVRQAMADMP